MLLAAPAGGTIRAGCGPSGQKLDIISAFQVWHSSQADRMQLQAGRQRHDKHSASGGLHIGT